LAQGLVAGASLLKKGGTFGADWQLLRCVEQFFFPC
jgi:hypothetical protein